MLIGRFGDTTGRPYIEGRLILPRLQIRSGISFLVDTGSDVTLLNPGDGNRMGVDYTQLTGSAQSTGIGGDQRNFIEPALVVFSEPGRRLYVYVIALQISPRALDERLPSLLGRNILDQWRIVYEPSRDRLTFTVRTADARVPIPR